MRALVVDDSSTMRSILKMMLKKSGFEVVEAGCGADALKQLEDSGAVNLTLLDWNMPGMNGYETLQAIRAHSAWSAMKVMMVTTETELSQVQAALKTGADEYVMKPFTADIIAEKLQLLGFGN